MRLFIILLLTTGFFTACENDKNDDAFTPTSPIQGEWRQISFSLSGTTVPVTEDYGLTLSISADSMHYYKNDSLINELSYKLTTVNNINVLTSTTAGYEDYMLKYTVSNDTLHLALAVSDEDNAATYVKIK